MPTRTVFLPESCQKKISRVMFLTERVFVTTSGDARARSLLGSAGVAAILGSIFLSTAAREMAHCVFLCCRGLHQQGQNSPVAPRSSERSARTRAERFLLLFRIIVIGNLLILTIIPIMWWFSHVLTYEFLFLLLFTIELSSVYTMNDDLVAVAQGEVLSAARP